MNCHVRQNEKVVTYMSHTITFWGRKQSETELVKLTALMSRVGNSFNVTPVAPRIRCFFMIYAEGAS